MGVFSSIMNKIFHHPAAKAAPRAQPAPQPQAAPNPQPTPAARAAPPQAQPAAMSQVDVEGVLGVMAQDKDGGGGNWRASIVDLLKLLDLDSSLQARKELADELGVHAAADGSAEQNIALHHAVMDKLAQNGGLVPDSLRQ